jgi:hypothetical protein
MVIIERQRIVVGIIVDVAHHGKEFIVYGIVAKITSHFFRTLQKAESLAVSLHSVEDDATMQTGACQQAVVAILLVELLTEGDERIGLEGEPNAVHSLGEDERIQGAVGIESKAVYIDITELADYQVRILKTQRIGFEQLAIAAMLRRARRKRKA